MILDGYWKKELKHNIRHIKMWIKLSRIFGGFAEHQINKYTLYSAIVIRKMHEDETHGKKEIKKAKRPMPPFKLLEHKVNVTVYPFSGDKEFIVERVVPDNYDYNNIVEKEIELNTLCNQIIHSFVWETAREQETNKFLGLLFASDMAKETVLYLLEPQEFINAIEFCIDI